MEKTITFKGETIKTKHWKELSEKEYQQLKNDYYKKPTLKEVRNEVSGIFLNGNVSMPKINNYFFKDLYSKVKMYHSKWSISDVFESKELMEFFNSKISDNEDVYPKTNSKIKNIETVFRLGGKGVASKPSNFKLDKTIDIIKKYNVNNNYYDPSCGWGVRMVGSLACGINYYGTDPNYKLTERLKELSFMFRDIDLFAPEVDIWTQGSEIYIPELENKIGLVFTSPPYFFLEDYRIGEQSTKKYPKYKDWLEKYLRKTLENCYRYMIKGGHILININDYDKYKLGQDTEKLLQEVGFKLVGYEDFDNIKRISSKKELNNNGEIIYVYQKKL